MHFHSHVCVCRVWCTCMPAMRFSLKQTACLLATRVRLRQLFVGDACLSATRLHPRQMVVCDACLPASCCHLLQVLVHYSISVLTVALVCLLHVSVCDMCLHALRALLVSSAVKSLGLRGARLSSEQLASSGRSPPCSTETHHGRLDWLPFTLAGTCLSSISCFLVVAWRVNLEFYDLSAVQDVLSCDL